MRLREHWQKWRFLVALPAQRWLRKWWEALCGWKTIWTGLRDPRLRESLTCTTCGRRFWRHLDGSSGDSKGDYCPDCAKE